ncbi:DUF1641 domain-containing protein [Halomicroarcula limicola]|uniref:DUF1641 domain-containing protein n=1 Tax=Haloarcula limicola TaxID=1429915 RepID=A0A8J7Y8E4_9EURY|nr:DUF1641 domain-containing protein [Halomicroarcula limicola]MBV0925987.1 DUF1641 domain-containing protein [Halomicroarcula limicola]
MANPTDVYPNDATNGERRLETGDGEAALREVLDRHGEALAAAVERTDEAEDALETAILMLATADEDEIAHLTASSANLLEAADGISTRETAELAADVGANASELADALDTVVALQRTGDLDDLVAIATAFSDSLSAEEISDLATVLEEGGGEMIETLEMLLELQRENHLEELVELATTLSTLEIDADTAAGLNAMLSALGEAQRDSESVGPLGLLSRLRSRDARAGLGFVVELLTALGSRIRRR